MFISQVEIDSYNRKKLRELSHVGAVHNWVESAFPAELDKGYRTRKLWRIDSLRGKQFLLMVSPESPELKMLERYGVEGTARTKPYVSFLENLKTGQRVRFKVTLNPVVAVKEEKGRRGRVKPHVTVSQQKQFLLNRSLKNGFEISDDEFEVTERAFVPLKGKGKPTINLSKVTYEGILTIIDLDSFQRTLIEGFGKKKAYGFGLMTVIPVGNYG